MCVVPEPIIIIVIIEKELHAVAPPIKCIALNYTQPLESYKCDRLRTVKKTIIGLSSSHARSKLFSNLIESENIDF